MDKFNPLPANKSTPCFLSLRGLEPVKTKRNPLSLQLWNELMAIVLELSVFNL